MLADLTALAPGGGVAGAVIALLIWHTRTGREDRAEYREALRAARAEYDERIVVERARVAVEHDRVVQVRAEAKADHDDLVRRLRDAERTVERLRTRRGRETP